MSEIFNNKALKEQSPLSSQKTLPYLEK